MRIRTYGACFSGRPPRLPFRRAAAAFAAEVTRPPFRPNATAAAFLRGTADYQRGLSQGLPDVIWRHGQGQGHQVREGRIQLETAFCAGVHEQAQAGGFGVEVGDPLTIGEIHKRTIPNRLGSVNG